MVLIHHFLQHIQAATGVTLQTHLVLRLNRVFFPVYILGVKTGGDEKLGKSIQRLW